LVAALIFFFCFGLGQAISLRVEGALKIDRALSLGVPVDFTSEVIMMI